MKKMVGIIIDPDAIAKSLNPSYPREADLSAGRKAVKHIRELIVHKQNFAIETTLSGSFALRHMHIAKENGYWVALYYIGLQDVQMHIDRVASRVEQGGHWIAEADIRWRYGHSLSNLKSALKLSDQVILIDNTFNRHQPSTLCSRIQFMWRRLCCLFGVILRTKIHIYWFLPHW
jgi:predicted ABC-type ATPase